VRRTRTVPALEVCDLGAPGPAGVALRGVVDAAGAQLLAEALEDAVNASEGPFLVDLREVVAMDPQGVAALVRTRSLLGQEERRLALVGPSWPVRAVLEDVGVADLFAAYASAGSALRAMSPAA
jgi:anti-sigma B factor antagonist